MGVQLAFPQVLPKSGWSLDDELPNLVERGAKWIAIDIESKDPLLKSRDPGFIRRDAHVAGVAVVADGFKRYYPVRHLQGPNLPPNIVFSWLSDQLGTDIPKIGANLGYDLEGLRFEGVKPEGKLIDVQIAEPLIDEELDAYSLDAIAERRLGKKKEEKLLTEASAIYQVHSKKELYKLPPEFVAQYAIEDASLSKEIWDLQQKDLSDQDLWEIFELESELLPVLLEMRLKGVPVDVERAHETARELTKREYELRDQIKSLVGYHLKVFVGDQMARAYRAVGVEHFKYTAKGNVSFDEDWFKGQDDPLSKLVLEVKKVINIRDNFIVGDIIEMSVDGRVHGQFNQLRGDSEGTRSGRLSSKNPNLQQVPSRDPVYGPLVRSHYLPEEGHKWGKLDYSGQEPRLTLHYAYLRKLPGAEEHVQKFLEDPRTDYHGMTAAIMGVTRKEAKAINLGITYGMGVDKLAASLGVSVPEADRLRRKYYDAIPYVLALSSECATVASNRGSIRTLLGRRRHFGYWQIRSKESRSWAVKGREKAEKEWPGQNLQRAFTHKALNALIQGSGADMMKKAIRDLYYDHGIVGHITVHDEFDESVESREDLLLIKNVMQTCCDVSVPMVVDASMGRSWGEATEDVL